jgi:hypothetical protein
MADTDLTGATKEIQVDTQAAVEKDERKKKIIKYLIIALVLVGGFFLVKKFILKR